MWVCHGERTVNGGPLGHFVIYSAKDLDVSRDPQAAPQTVPAYCTSINGRELSSCTGQRADL